MLFVIYEKGVRGYKKFNRKVQVHLYKNTIFISIDKRNDLKNNVNRM